MNDLMSDERWNHNIHCHRLILDAIPAGARSALDVGTGNGLLAVELRCRVPEVTGIDTDAGVLDSARLEDPGVTWIHGDFMTHEFRQRFDVLASVATLHHLPDLRAALERMRTLASPGGVVVVVGLARPTRVRDHALHAVGLVQHLWLKARRGYWEHSAPTVWPPPHSYAEVRRVAADVMPGARWRQLPMWRYALVWMKS